MLRNIIHYAKGTVRLEVKGAYPERFLNLCMRHDISLWDMKRTDINRLETTTTIKDFRKMRRFAAKTQCKIHLRHKKGLPFFLFAMRARPMLLAGILLFALTVFITGTRVWSIDIVGGEGLYRHRLLYELDGLGVKVGVKTSSIEPRDIKNAMLSRMDDLAFIAVNVRGNGVTVEVEKRVEKPRIEETDTPCSIVADKTGVIESMDVKAGLALKEVGQTVVTGDVLVDALVPSKREGITPRLVHAAADIELRTWFQVERVLPANIPEKEYTGKTKTRYSLIFGKRRYNLFGNGGNAYEFCDKLVTQTDLRLSESLVIPFGLVKEELTEYVPRDSVLPKEQSKSILLEHGREDLQRMIGDGDILSYQGTAVFYSDRVVLSVAAECLESAGIEEMDTRKEADLVPEEVETEKS